MSMKEPNIEDYREDDDFPHQYLKDLEIWVNEKEIEAEEEGENFNHFYVDIPQLVDTETWINVATFATREEAIKFAKEVYGADDEGKVSLITPI